MDEKRKEGGKNIKKKKKSGSVLPSKSQALEGLWIKYIHVKPRTSPTNHVTPYEKRRRGCERNVNFYLGSKYDVSEAILLPASFITLSCCVKFAANMRFYNALHRRDVLCGVGEKKSYIKIGNAPPPPPFKFLCELAAERFFY